MRRGGGMKTFIAAAEGRGAEADGSVVALGISGEEATVAMGMETLWGSV